MKDRIILGVDPGTNILGYGLLHDKGNKIELITMNVLKLSALSDHMVKLKTIFDSLSGIIELHKPDELSVEAPFYGKNVQSMLKLGRAQGVCIAAALAHQLPVFEYSPRKIKQSVTGKGNASKEQVAGVLSHLLHISTRNEFYDATDALAAAVCHYMQKDYQAEASQYSGWKSFLTQHPDRINKPGKSNEK